MKIHFHKYQGAGNDFVMIDNFSGQYDELTVRQIQNICDRKFGIGADGLIKINKHPYADFEVDYYNADGSKSFCGNGARCSIAFVDKIKGINGEVKFDAIDGIHVGSKVKGQIKIDMLDVQEIEQRADNVFILNTGSPHYIIFESDIDKKDMVKIGRDIRYSEEYKAVGINVNLVEELSGNNLKIRTYERGVEDETLACGTGITAAALAYSLFQNTEGKQDVKVDAVGGKTSVVFEYLGENNFKNIFLTGPAEFVFKGEIDVE